MQTYLVRLHFDQNSAPAIFELDAENETAAIEGAREQFCEGDEIHLMGIYAQDAAKR